MAVTPLGIVGSTTTAAATVNLTLTTAVSASDETTSRIVMIRYHAAIADFTADLSFDTSDDATPTNPNKCWGPNVYTGSGGSLSINAAGYPPDGFLSTYGYLVAEMYQPLEIGSIITFTFGADVPTFFHAYALAYDDAQPAVFTGIGFDGFADGPPVANCISAPRTLPADTEYVVSTIVELLTSGVSSITYQETVSVLASYYDQGGALHLSGTVAEAAASPGAWDIGGCTDVYPTGPASLPGQQFSGLTVAITPGFGLARCPGIEGSIFIDPDDPMSSMDDPPAATFGVLGTAVIGNE